MNRLPGALGAPGPKSHHNPDYTLPFISGVQNYTRWVNSNHKRSTFECVDKDLESSIRHALMPSLVMSRLCVLHYPALFTTITKRSTVLCHNVAVTFNN